MILNFGEKKIQIICTQKSLQLVGKNIYFYRIKNYKIKIMVNIK